MKRKSSHRRQQYSNVRDLLMRGIAAAKAGNQEEARFYLEWVLITEATDEQRLQAWLWLSEVSETADEKRTYLEEILARRPGHALARRKLALLDGKLRAEEIVDPDSVRPPSPDAEETAGGRRFVCPQCAARLVYTPDGASLHCEHCGFRQTPRADNLVEEKDFIATMATARGHLHPIATPTFSCQSCAASFMLAPGTLSVTCPYCDHAYAVSSRETRDLVPPEGIIPFVVDQTQAQHLLNGWLARQRRRPYAAMRGIYLPAWTFDVGGTIDWVGELVAHENSMRSRVTRTGQRAVYVDDFVVPACRTLPDELEGVVRTFDLSQLVAFDPSYLAAWPAQSYEVTVGDASLKARRHAYDRGRRHVRESHDDLQNLRFSSAGITILSFKLILLPLWIGQYQEQGRPAMVVVGGQTGKLLGKRSRRSGLVRGLQRWISDLLG